MKTVITFLLVLLVSLAGACPAGDGTPGSANNGRSGLSGEGGGDASERVSPDTPGSDTSGQKKPRTVREFFMAFNQDVFLMEGCEEAKDPDCLKAKKEYLDTYLEVEDTKNGYLSAGADGAQATLTMTIFRRPDDSYIVAVNKSLEIEDDYSFWEYRNGTWKDISAETIPEYSKENIYELPRFGTTVKVYKKLIQPDGVTEVLVKGEKLYDLIWKEGKFTISK